MGFDSYGHPQQKNLIGQEFSGMGCLRDILCKGQRITAGWGVRTAHPMHLRVKMLILITNEL